MPTATEAAELVDAYWPLALVVARRMGARVPWLLDDLISEAGLSLWRAALSWQPGETTFAAWARRQIRWAALKRIRVESRKNPTAFRPQLVDARGEPADLAALVADDSPEVGTVSEAGELVERILGTLPPDRRRDLVRVVAEDAAFADLAAEQNVTASSVRQRVRTDLRRLRERTEE